MTEYAMIVDGELQIVSPRPVTADGIQHPSGVFRLWTDADLAALGVWRVDREAVPAGMWATEWALAVVGNRVTATPTLAEVPPQPVAVTVEQLAAALAPPAENGGGLVPGRWYAEGTEVVIGGDTYDVTMPFLHVAGWGVEHLAAHLTRRVAPGEPWVQPAGAHDAYGVGAQVVHNGRLWSNTHGAGNIWEPGVFGWADLGPV